MEILNREDEIERLYKYFYGVTRCVFLLSCAHMFTPAHLGCRFELLEVLTFDSVRRRMSVIVRSGTGMVKLCPLKFACFVCLSHTLNTCPVCALSRAGELYLFCKGADSSIFPRVISGKVDQVRARVEHNAVVSDQ